ncbi:MAG: permease [Deltaproteobacteria bacterium]|nr:permease [Deltaproteobacteria bacterium]
MQTAHPKKSKKTDLTFIILAALLLAAILFATWKGGWSLTASGFIKTGHIVEKVWFRLLLGFILGGLIQELIPRDMISKWLGPESGLKGILIASYAGIFLAGSPYMMLPVFVSIYRAGAGVGPLMALLSGRGLLSLQLLLVWQIPFLGVELSVARYLACIIVPPIAGLAGNAVYKLFDRPGRRTLEGRPSP